MAGSEARGPEHATAELFSGATWFLTPIDETRPERYQPLHAFVSGLGAVPVAIRAPGARPTRCADESSTACACQSAAQPGRDLSYRTATSHSPPPPARFAT